MSEAGFLVELARTGLDGHHLAMTGDHDLLILDVMMEDLVAGFRVVNQLRNFDAFPQNRKYEKVPILMMTSIQQQTRMKFSQDAGSRLLPIDAFLEKPVKPRALLQKISELLNR